MRVGDILHNFEEKYAAAKARHEAILKSLNYEYDITELEKQWMEGIEYLRQFPLVDSEHEINRLLNEGKSVLCEGAQGTMLDVDFGSYPFVTSSNTICAGACTGLGLGPNKIGEVYGIMKAYCTRVGSGPFPTELFDETGKTIRDLGHEYGAVTGRERRCGWVDLVALRYAIMVNGVTQLILMKSDVLDGFDTIKACVAYKVNGEEIDYFPYDITEGVEPVYAELPGCPNAADYLVLIYACVLMSCLRTLCTQFIRSRMLNRLVAVDGVLTSATLLGFYYLFLDVLDLGANGYLLAMACSDALSAIFVFIVGHCHQYFSFKKFNKALWKDMLRYCIPMIPASISFWIINASDLFYVQGMCDGIDGKSSTWWVGLLKAGYYLPQIITIVGQIFYEAWQLSAVTEESERSAFFSKVFRVYAAVMFCCVAGVIWLCQPMMHVFREDYFLGWQFVPFLTLASMCTCLNNFLNSVYVVYKRSTSSFYTMLVGAVVNLVLNFLFIRWFGPWGVTVASFISLLIVFLLRAYSTHGLLEIDFHPAWMLLNLGLIFVEIAMLFKLEHWVLPVTVLTFAICLLNFREVFAMVEKLLGMVLHRRKKSN